jgi:hypothetical protein
MFRTTRAAKLMVGLGAAAGAGHVLYPVALAVACRLRPSGSTSSDGRGADDPWPPITVVIPAFREVGTVRGKIENIRSNTYGGDITIIVVAEDAETAASARTAGVTVIEPPHRLGKSQAINAGVTAAVTTIVVITDANNELVPGSLAALVRHFDDEAVGAVTGEKTEEDQGEALYWRFESWLKERESELGSTLGIVGELFAVRKEAWRAIPRDIGIDDLWIALDLADRGYAVRFERGARSVEAAIPAAQQWERRTRNLAGVLYVISRKRQLLSPRRGLVAAEIVGHKLWRSSVGPIAHVALIAVAIGARRQSVLARLVLGVHGAGLVAAAVAHRGHSLPRPLAVLRQVLYLQAVAVGGLVRFVRGETSPTWQKAAR